MTQITQGLSYKFTLLGKELTSHHFQALANFFQRYHLVHVESQTKTLSEGQGHDATQFIVTAEQPFEILRDLCLSFSETEHVDLVVQSLDFNTKQCRLVCFDMDSTLIGQEVIDELAKEAGIGAQVAEITERAMQGELDFQESFRARVALLKGLDIDVLEKIASRLTINEGAARLISTLKAQGIHTAIFSGGFQYFAEYLQKKLGLDEVHANTLDIQNGYVTGEVKGTIVDGARKAELLKELSIKLDIGLEQTIAVGDGANDLPMLSLAGVGVAFRAKPLVRKSAKQAISHVGLDGVLYLLDYSDNQIETNHI
ncbi:phosphoserine phosphatase SerB [Acinetobacter nectaris CIP 110549]|uniref:Phosphoserine phosphatase n=1 Tax=Acinetobacter nectaris CIP 110549 TaxID=1392540 RepID=V2TLU4_9GAMM|nr:phosphoserine phosphatase SerB [Acinetobacter nectaris CIP 110549]